MLPSNSNLTLSTEESTANLNIVAKGYPESGTTQTTNVLFVKEDIIRTCDHCLRMAPTLPGGNRSKLEKIHIFNCLHQNSEI